MGIGVVGAVGLAWLGAIAAAQGSPPRESGASALAESSRAGATAMAGGELAAKADASPLEETYRKEEFLAFARGSGATPFTYPDSLGYGPIAIAADGRSNLYVLFNRMCEVRMFDPQGRYVKTFQWPETEMECTNALKVDDAGDVHLWGSTIPFDERVLRVKQDQSREQFHLASHRDWDDLVPVDGFLVHPKRGVLGRFKGAPDKPSDAKLLRALGARVVDYQPRGLGKGGGVILDGRLGRLDLSPDPKYPRAGAGALVGVDQNLSVYMQWGVRDPSIRVQRARGEFAGSRKYIGKYDRLGRLKAWIECERVISHTSYAVDSTGIVYQLWGPETGGLFVTRWTPAK